SVLATPHRREISKLRFPWRAFLFLACTGRSRPGNRPGFVSIRAGVTGEAGDMTARCEARAGLSIGEIHVWTARLADDRRVTAALMPLLSREERAQAAQFAFEHDRMRFIQAHASVRQILSGYLEADAATLAFARNRNGKPCLVPQANGPKLQFSVSHSSDCCMLAVRLDQPVGIDVERIRDLPREIDIAQTYFAPAESRALNDLRGTARRDAFFSLWTHKEALVKALGISLAP